MNNDTSSSKRSILVAALRAYIEDCNKASNDPRMCQDEQDPERVAEIFRAQAKEAEIILQEVISGKQFAVVGIHEEDYAPYLKIVNASTWQEAKETCLQEHPDLIIGAIIPGMYIGCIDAIGI